MKPQRLAHAAPAALPSRCAASPLAAVLLGAVLLAGCADSPYFQKSEARTASHPKATAVLERDTAAAREAPARARERDRERDPDAAPRESAGLREGIRMYNEGDFEGAIRRLSARDLNNGPLATRLTAIKYIAFSYCVTGRPAQCRQNFDKALRLDPSFELAPGEQGHPLWGPVFAKAKGAFSGRQ